MNKDIFFKVYKNKVLNNKINIEIRFIHNKIYKDAIIFKWKEVTQSLNVLSQYGYYDQFKLLSQSNLNLNISIVGGSAARYGHLNILKYIVDNHKPSSMELVVIFCNALGSGNISMIEYVYSLAEWDSRNYSDFFQAIAVEGTIEVCEWFVNYFKDIKKWCEPNIFYDCATFSGNLNTLKWGTQFYNDSIEYENHSNIWINAIKNKNISILDFMYSQELFKSSFNLRFYMILAIRHSNSKIVEWIISKAGDYTLLDFKDLYIALRLRGNMKIIECCSNKLGYKAENYKNINEWLLEKCGQ